MSTISAPSPPAGVRSAPAAPEGRRRGGADGWSRWSGVAFVTPVVLYLTLFYAYPLAQNVMMSVRRYDRAAFVSGEAPFVGVEIYREVLSAARFWEIVTQTGIFTAVSLTAQYVLGLALAVFFRRAFPLSSTLRALFLVPWLLPVIVSGTTWQWMMNADNGILNSFLGIFGVDSVWWLNADNALMSVVIANIWLGVPFNLVILYSGLQNIPDELYEAASVDGAGAWRQFWSVTMPLLRPVTLITLLLGLVYTLKVVDVIWIMTMGTGTSQTLATWSYSLAFGKGTSGVIQYSQASAVGSLLLLIALFFGLVYIAIQRRQEARA